MCCYGQQCCWIRMCWCSSTFSVNTRGMLRAADRTVGAHIAEAPNVIPFSTLFLFSFTFFSERLLRLTMVVQDIRAYNWIHSQSKQRSAAKVETFPQQKKTSSPLTLYVHFCCQVHHHWQRHFVHIILNAFTKQAALIDLRWDVMRRS